MSARKSAVVKTREALDLLKQFAEPDIISYNCLLHAYSGSGESDQALNLLEWLEKHPKLEPDVYSYNTVLDGWSKSKDSAAALHAEQLLERMEELANAKPTLQPKSYPATLQT